MPKPKPYESIATRFQISNESAKYFLGKVQKSFKDAKPTQSMIIDFMQAQKFKSLPLPYKVAVMMNEYGVWAHPLGSEPAVPQDEKDIYF